MKKEHMWLGIAFLLGVVLSPKVRTIPLLNKLPSV